MKKIICTGLFLFLAALYTFAADQFVFVDLARVFEGFYKTQLAKSKVEVQQKDIEAERQIMVDEMTHISETVDILKKEARDVTLTEEIRDGKRMLYEERLLELRDQQKEIEEFTSRRSEQLQLQVSRMSQTIMDEIRQSIVEYAKEEGLQAVIDKSTRRGAAIGVFIYTHPDIDITDAMLTKLNSTRPDTMNIEDLFEESPSQENDNQEPPATQQ